MSGQEIGAVVGGIAGFAIGGPAGAQLGMALGGLVGGLVDPTKINGPHIGDGQQQAATDGVPIAWVMGTALVAGTIAQVCPRYEVKVKDSGKGGPTVSHYEAHQSFAIVVCESSEIRGSTIGSILMVMQDGKIVYDVRPGSGILSDSAKWLSTNGVQFLYGDEQQMPHPTLEASSGVGNTCAYRGSCLAVFTGMNLTPAGGRIPSFQFLVQASGAARSIPYTDPGWKYLVTDPGTDDSPSAIDFDDASWLTAPGGFGTTFSGAVTNTPIADPGKDYSIWLRRRIYANAGNDAYFNVYHDNGFILYWNGVEFTRSGYDSVDKSTVIIPGNQVLVDNVLSVRVTESSEIVPGNYWFAGVDFSQPSPAPVGALTLAQVIANVCDRGGLNGLQIDVADLVSTTVLGYPIATQMVASDALAPLLSAYFCYGSEYDGQLHFHKFGANAILTIDREDLVETNANDDGSSIVATVRNLETEFPRRVTSTYIDPQQNYQPVNVSRGRDSSTVLAIGQTQFQIPVVMSALDAVQATDKALKVAYATLQGTREYSVPFVGRSGNQYLTLVPGDSVILDARRWGVDQVTVSDGYVHLKTTYSRQDAYVSSVQPIASLPPIPTVSTDPGITTLIPMNLPALRPQDTVGFYLAAYGSKPAWNGCTVQVSLDAGATWNNALTINESSIAGVVAVDEPDSGEPLSVTVNGDLESIAPATLAAGGNPAAVFGVSDVCELLQFQTTTETAPGDYDLTVLTRSNLGTPGTEHAAGEQFVMLDSVYFYPLDVKFIGQTILFRGVSNGQDPTTATVVSIVYTALQYIVAPTYDRIDVDGNFRVDVDGNQRVSL